MGEHLAAINDLLGQSAAVKIIHRIESVSFTVVKAVKFGYFRRPVDSVLLKEPDSKVKHKRLESRRLGQYIVLCYHHIGQQIRSVAGDIERRHGHPGRIKTEMNRRTADRYYTGPFPEMPEEPQILCIVDISDGLNRNIIGAEKPIRIVRFPTCVGSIQSAG